MPCKNHLRVMSAPRPGRDPSHERPWVCRESGFPRPETEHSLRVFVRSTVASNTPKTGVGYQPDPISCLPMSMPSESGSQIIALGGGGFSSDPDGPWLDLFVLDCARRSSPSVCFIATATGDAPGYIEAFYAAYRRLDCTPTHLPFFGRTPDLGSAILSQDVIYVGGGNTKSMLAVWREWGLIPLLKEAYLSGTVLAGISAGAICWFRQGLTDSYAHDMVALDCLGFLGGSCSPHYDGEADRRPSYQRLVLSGQIEPGYALDDGVAAHFVDGRFHRAASSRIQARAYRVEVRDSAVVEEMLPTEYLGACRE